MTSELGGYMGAGNHKTSGTNNGAAGNDSAFKNNGPKPYKGVGVNVCPMDNGAMTDKNFFLDPDGMTFR